VIIQLSWTDVRRAHPEKFDRIITSICRARSIDRGQAIDVLDDEYFISVTSDGCIKLEEEASGRYRTMC
jgi:hypothetical protein